MCKNHMHREYTVRIDVYSFSGRRNILLNICQYFPIISPDWEITMPLVKEALQQPTDNLDYPYYYK